MVLDKIREMVADQFSVNLDSVTAETSFVDDLGADSLDVVELTMALEQEFALPETPEDALMGINTVGDLANYVAKVTAE